VAKVIRQTSEIIRDLRNVRYRAGFGHAAALLTAFALQLIRLKSLKRKVGRTNPRRAIVVISLLENFGDIVACEPVARHVKEKDPSAFIVWLVASHNRELVQFNPHVDHVLILSCLTEWIWLSRFIQFDSVVDLQLPGRVCHDCRIPLNKSAGDQAVTFDNYYNFGSLLTAFSRSAGLPPLNEPANVYIPDSVARRVDQQLSAENFIVFHCQSCEDSRDWLPAKWRELAERVQADCAVRIVEVGTSSVLAQTGLGNFENFCGKLSLLETAEVIKRSKLFVGIDSGPAHFANALDVFGIILLGRYHAFERYLPYSGNYTDPAKAEIIYANGPAASIEVESIFSAIQRRLGLASALSQVA